MYNVTALDFLIHMGFPSSEHNPPLTILCAGQRGVPALRAVRGEGPLPPGPASLHQRARVGRVRVLHGVRQGTEGGVLRVGRH
jgi:hypothetical protein